MHYIKEVEINTALTLSTMKDYTHGDNRDVIATDSQKNTCYVLAKKHGIKVIEEFAMLLSKHFLNQYPWVRKTDIYIEEFPWKRINQGGREHNHAWVHGETATRFCRVQQEKHGLPQVSAGLKNMRVLKTTQSSFVNFVDDEYRSLPDMPDRVFATVVEARWQYDRLAGLDFCRAWNAVKNTFLDIFAGPPDCGLFSPSVQHTIYLVQKAALSKVPQMSRIEITLPNVHYYTYDLGKLKKLDLGKNNEVFQPVNKPSGNIRCELGRRSLSKL